MSISKNDLYYESMTFMVATTLGNLKKLDRQIWNFFEILKISVEFKDGWRGSGPSPIGLFQSILDVFNSYDIKLTSNKILIIKIKYEYYKQK